MFKKKKNYYHFVPTLYTFIYFIFFIYFSGKHIKIFLKALDRCGHPCMEKYSIYYFFCIQYLAILRLSTSADNHFHLAD